MIIKYRRGTFVGSIRSEIRAITSTANTMDAMIDVNSKARYSLKIQRPNHPMNWIKNISNKDNFFKNMRVPFLKVKNGFLHSAALLLLLIPSFAVAQADNTKETGPANTEDEYEKRYQERITKDRLHGVYIPRNLDDALAQLDKNITAESKDALKVIPEDSICLRLHDRLGRWMITNWCFYEGSRLSHYLRSAGVTYPDDMADFLIIAYHRHLNGKPVEIKSLAQYYRETRKKEFQEEKKEGKVLKEEVRKRPKEN
jgi:hypothetical protein